MNNPQTFNEKIQYRKFNVADCHLYYLVDKYEVRKYVSEMIGDKYLNPLILHKDRITPDDLMSIDVPFVVKTTNGGGGNNVKLVFDFEEVDLEEVCNEFNTMVSQKVGTLVDESFYDYKDGTIIVEELFCKAHTVPDDFKIHVFNASNKTRVFIQVDKDRFSNHSRSIYDERLKKTKFVIQPKYPEVSDTFGFPIGIHEAIRLARELSKPFSYVRVDMYVIDDLVRFGELTFCHGSGWEPFIDFKQDVEWGAFWEIKNDCL